jgi:hypothetical protein
VCLLCLSIGPTPDLVQQIADWVADSILKKQDSRRRAQIVKHLILVADVSQDNLFSTCHLTLPF